MRLHGLHAHAVVGHTWKYGMQRKRLYASVQHGFLFLWCVQSIGETAIDMCPLAGRCMLNLSPDRCSICMYATCGLPHLDVHFFQLHFITLHFRIWNYLGCKHATHFGSNSFGRTFQVSGAVSTILSWAGDGVKLFQ